MSGGSRDIASATNGYVAGHDVAKTNAGLELICGPLLNYKWMSNSEPGPSIWFGSVLIVTKPGSQHPRLRLKRVDRIKGDLDHNSQSPRRVGNNSVDSPQDATSIDGIKLYADTVGVFWRFDIESRVEEFETRWEYSIPDVYDPPGASPRTVLPYTFVVPALSQSMRIMFHSCNGFSVGTDLDTWKGPELWHDVLRIHEQKPFHVMVGGGDQIYNDGVRVSGPLKAWTHINNPKKRRDFPFDESLRKDCDRFYFDNYIKWFSTEPFATANARIPQVNIWDDHGMLECAI